MSIASMIDTKLVRENPPQPPVPQQQARQRLPSQRVYRPDLLISLRDGFQVKQFFCT